MLISPAIAPQYPKCKCDRAQYTPGGDFTPIDDPAEDYVGLYHVLPNGEPWTEPEPSCDSKRLIPKLFDPSQASNVYNRIKNRFQEYIDMPMPFQPMPDDSDYARGFLNRNFMQNIRDINSLIEISPSGMVKLKSGSLPGSQFIKSVSVKWELLGNNAASINKTRALIAESVLPGISSLLSDPNEFVKKQAMSLATKKVPQLASILANPQRYAKSQILAEAEKKFPGITQFINSPEAFLDSKLRDALQGLLDDLPVKVQLSPKFIADLRDSLNDMESLFPGISKFFDDGIDAFNFPALKNTKFC